jgi:hypothetical protein
MHRGIDEFVLCSRVPPAYYLKTRMYSLVDVHFDQRAESGRRSYTDRVWRSVSESVINPTRTGPARNFFCVSTDAEHSLYSSRNV